MSKINEDLKPFVAGQWAYSIRNGWEKIIGTDGDKDYPVFADSDRYTVDGRGYPNDVNPSLFHTDIFNGTQPPEPEIDWDKVPRDTEVEVRGSDAQGWEVRFFSHKHKNGRFYCFSNGRKSEESFDINGWRQCRLIHQSDIEKYSK